MTDPKNTFQSKEVNLFSNSSALCGSAEQFLAWPLSRLDLLGAVLHHSVAWEHDRRHLLTPQCVFFWAARVSKLRLWGAAFGKCSELWLVAAHVPTHRRQCAQHPVQSSLDDQGDGTEEGVGAAHPEQHHQTVCNLVHWDVLVLSSLAADKIPKSYCAERHEAEVEGLYESPALHGRIEGRSPTRNQQGSSKEDDCHQIDGWLPRLGSGTATGRDIRSTVSGSPPVAPG